MVETPKKRLKRRLKRRTRANFQVGMPQLLVTIENQST